MICRDFMLRVCSRNPCKMRHKVVKCTNEFCNHNILCKRMHLTDCEVDEINQNIRSFRQSVYNEMNRLAYILRESFQSELRMHCCILNMLGQCIWTCLACRTTSSESAPACNNCYIKLKRNLKALTCGHTYCKYCYDQLPIRLDGPLPLYNCKQCGEWPTIFLLFNR
ncbi:PREDICTED: uncharacterized protein LOC105455740 [Wasmannia auropunctata]|uniref:uncharacterized protein LOC105455740 n=1 Tax=Wasmannia auropunctata TaxID=64793 RepID=UPI0005EE8CDF|nr:PREDICTED: uncharacterized protein LOC105455740 [Wasmannia auropunctata]